MDAFIYTKIQDNIDDKKFEVSIINKEIERNRNI